MPMNWWASFFIIILLMVVMSFIYFDCFMLDKFSENYNKINYLNNWKW